MGTSYFAETNVAIDNEVRHMADNPLRILPAVNDVLDQPALHAARQAYPQNVVTDAVRAELEDLRRRIGSSDPTANGAAAATVAERVVARLAKEMRPHLRRVINATGIVLHTNLGRAPQADAAAQAGFDAAKGYLNLELDLATGKRSSRQDAIRGWLCRLTGAEAATAVNNCAAATVIVLRAIAAGREVVVSRGQLIEIGGSFRIPEIMSVSGATLHEVGTTNITRISDYERAIGPSTAALMRIHTSNYIVSGHTETPSLSELVALGRKHGIPVIDDVGSGALVDYARFGLTGEPLVRASIESGADLVLHSGDKLLGGPQAGVIVGRKDLIARIERDPMMRALRLDKVTLASLEATLRIYLDEERAVREVPVLRMLNAKLDELKKRADALAARMRGVFGIAADVRTESAFVGGGSLPQQSMPTIVIAIAASGISTGQLSERLRSGDPAVMGRIQNDRLLLDIRTIFAEQDSDLVEAVRRASQQDI